MEAVLAAPDWGHDADHLTAHHTLILLLSQLLNQTAWPKVATQHSINTGMYRCPMITGTWVSREAVCDSMLTQVTLVTYYNYSQKTEKSSKHSSVVRILLIKMQT